MDTSDEALASLLNRLKVCVADDEIHDLSCQIEAIIFHKQWGRFPTCPPENPNGTLPSAKLPL
jgi:hypothetical protein